MEHVGPTLARVLGRSVISTILASNEIFSIYLKHRGINFMLNALVFNIVPTIFEVSLVTAILVS